MPNTSQIACRTSARRTGCRARVTESARACSASASVTSAPQRPARSVQLQERPVQLASVIAKTIGHELEHVLGQLHFESRRLSAHDPQRVS